MIAHWHINSLLPTCIHDAVTESPHDAQRQLEWGLQLTYLGESQLRFSQSQLALETFQGAIECFEKCAAVSPDLADGFSERAFWPTEVAIRRYFEAYNAFSLAMLLMRANLPLEAREYWTQSLDAFDALAQEFPESLKFRQRYAQAVSNEGSRLSTVGDAAGALMTFEQAVEMYAGLVSVAPYDATNQHGLAMALGNEAMLLATEDQFAEGLGIALRSLEVWDTYLELRPDSNADFRQAVVWKAAELLAQQATEKLADDPTAALALAQQEVELVRENWEQNQLLQQMVTLHALELALAEAGIQWLAESPEDSAPWLLVLEELVARLQERQPEDAAVLAVSEQLESLKMVPP